MAKKKNNKTRKIKKEVSDQKKQQQQEGEEEEEEEEEEKKTQTEAMAAQEKKDKKEETEEGTEEDTDDEEKVQEETEEEEDDEAKEKQELEWKEWGDVDLSEADRDDNNDDDDDDDIFQKPGWVVEAQLVDGSILSGQNHHHIASYLELTSFQLKVLSGKTGRIRVEVPTEDQAHALVRAIARQEEKFANIFDQSFECTVMGPRQAEPCCTTTTWVFFILATIASLFLMRMRILDQTFGNDFSVSAPPSVDYYKVLGGLSRDATDRQVTRSYRKLAIKWHPDKCEAKDKAICQEQFRVLSEAYEVLGDPKRRRMYDNIDTSFKPLPSAAVELTTENYADLVEKGDGEALWIIQVYLPWQKSCIWFGNSWEGAIETFSRYSIRFGRVHAMEQDALARSLPAAFGVFPTVVAVRAGVPIISRAFYSDAVKRELAGFITQNYPVVPWDSSKELQITVVSRHKQASLPILAAAEWLQDVCTIRYVVATSVEARRLIDAHPKPSPAASVFITGPATLTLDSSSSSSFWIREKITRTSLQRVLQRVLTQHFILPSLSSLAYHRLCLATSAPSCAVLLAPAGAADVASLRALATHTSARSAHETRLYAISLSPELDKVLLSPAATGAEIVIVSHAGDSLQTLQVDTLATLSPPRPLPHVPLVISREGILFSIAGVAVSAKFVYSVALSLAFIGVIMPNIGTLRRTLSSPLVFGPLVLMAFALQYFHKIN